MSMTTSHAAQGFQHVWLNRHGTNNQAPKRTRAGLRTVATKTVVANENRDGIFSNRLRTNRKSGNPAIRTMGEYGYAGDANVNQFEVSKHYSNGHRHRSHLCGVGGDCGPVHVPTGGSSKRGHRAEDWPAVWEVPHLRSSGAQLLRKILQVEGQVSPTLTHFVPAAHAAGGTYLRAVGIPGPAVVAMPPLRGPNSACVRKPGRYGARPTLRLST
jgi:hypothetical protein